MQSDSSQFYSSSSTKTGLGLASAEAFTGASSSLVALIRFDEKDAIQAYLSLPSTSPFTFSVGGIYKHTVTETPQGAGLHLGGGLSLGTFSKTGVAGIDVSDLISAAGGTGIGSSTGFALRLSGVAGLHFPLAVASKVMVHLDGGPTFSLLDGNAGFEIGAHSMLLGVSVVYML
ncbi:MAG: hypothetical protein NDJ89_03150 [Oligoflexia bacterium]|nr:hypothetical protein [Oligoflexia bacterium]